MVPLLFSFDMGSELQKPLSIAMIGAMFVGTLVSLFIIPLIYWFIYRKKEHEEIKSYTFVQSGSLFRFAQQRITLDLQQTIALANDSSLEAFRTKNMYLAGYWEYRTYKANRFPA